MVQVAFAANGGFVWLVRQLLSEVTRLNALPIELDTVSLVTVSGAFPVFWTVMVLVTPVRGDGEPKLRVGGAPLKVVSVP